MKKHLVVVVGPTENIVWMVEAETNRPLEHQVKQEQ
jgi:hypothetical protein